MKSEFWTYHGAVESLLAADVWNRLGEEEKVSDQIGDLRSAHIELSDAGALPALVFVQAVARVTDRAALHAFLRAHDRLGRSEGARRQLSRLRRALNAG